MLPPMEAEVACAITRAIANMQKLCLAGEKERSGANSFETNFLLHEKCSAENEQLQK